MPTPDLSAMPTSDLNPFLFSGVGTQSNGVELTMLSLLARLGSDPWAEAARLALLPRPAATDWLAERIGTMPLNAQAPDAARDTASRLLLLLPARTTIDRAVAGAKVEGRSMPVWAVAAFVLGIITLGLVASQLQVTSPGAPGQTIPRAP